MKLTDVVDRINGNVDRFNTDLEYYIGGEHFDSEELIISKRGTIKDNLGKLGFKFHFAFQDRDVIFMARNPHLRKAGMVRFSGLCSDASYILRSKNEKVISQDFLAVMLQSDRFWDYCESHKVGSVNFANNWSTIANYEFQLPDPKFQRELADKVWAAYEVKQSYLKMIAATEEMVKAQFIEMFDFEHNSYNWPVLKFNDFASLDCSMTTDYVTYADYPHIGIDSIEQNTGRLFGYRTVKEDNVKSGKYIFTPNHIIYSKIRPNLNKVATPDFDGLCSADSYPILANEDVTSKEFLAYLMRSDVFLRYVVPLSNRTGMPKVNREQVEGFTCPMPFKDMQNRFVAIYHQADKSISELRKSKDAIDKVIKSLINENL